MVVEAYYSIQQLAALLNMSESWVRRKINAGELGSGVIEIDRDIRIPASGINAFIERHRRVYSEPIKARNRGELRRKLNDQD